MLLLSDSLATLIGLTSINNGSNRFYHSKLENWGRICIGWSGSGAATNYARNKVRKIIENIEDLDDYLFRFVKEMNLHLSVLIHDNPLAIYEDNQPLRFFLICAYDNNGVARIFRLSFNLAERTYYLTEHEVWAAVRNGAVHAQVIFPCAKINDSHVDALETGRYAVLEAIYNLPDSCGGAINAIHMKPTSAPEAKVIENQKNDDSRNKHRENLAFACITHPVQN